MAKSIIEKLGVSPAEAKDLENAIANADKFKAFMDYIAVCDHPEMFEGESEVMDNE